MDIQVPWPNSNTQSINMDKNMVVDFMHESVSVRLILAPGTWISVGIPLLRNIARVSLLI